MKSKQLEGKFRWSVESLGDSRYDWYELICRSPKLYPRFVLEE